MAWSGKRYAYVDSWLSLTSCNLDSFDKTDSNPCTASSTPIFVDGDASSCSKVSRSSTLGFSLLSSVMINMDTSGQNGSTITNKARIDSTAQTTRQRQWSLSYLLFFSDKNAV